MTKSFAFSLMTVERERNIGRGKKLGTERQPIGNVLVAWDGTHDNTCLLCVGECMHRVRSRTLGVWLVLVFACEGAWLALAGASLPPLRARGASSLRLARGSLASHRPVRPPPQHLPGGLPGDGEGLGPGALGERLALALAR
eukprot:CAMPEP_0181319742 /NCGR_PEP_ID=MMETSP1101-20121128/17741_1 /TAXON_ID=46948 /ORGANISM="Rhodomonas abbreviata, Strain Caron Lab Isolate" /LENGTH=141 /DNA_ID=CAMNT_0023427377 /DNA_START=177 /DNA_END=599 /DNA_ORIENTATION=-